MAKEGHPHHGHLSNVVVLGWQRFESEVDDAPPA